MFSRYCYRKKHRNKLVRSKSYSFFLKKKREAEKRENQETWRGSLALLPGL